MSVTIAMPRMSTDPELTTAQSKYVESLARAGASVRWVELADPDKAVAEALPGIRERLDRLSHALPVRSAEAETVKLILGLEDGECVESVLLPRQGLCVSTQVGCAVGCVFCMTGKGGLVRQLSSAEIVAQYCEARRVRSDVRTVSYTHLRAHET